MDEFKHSHSLGQNFLTDINLLKAIAADACVSAEDCVIEVGAGMGSLTKVLAETGAKVFSFEIDERLKKYLDPLEKSHPNLTVIYGDFMKYDLGEIKEEKFKGVANLPYYITTPVLFKLLDSKRLTSATVMVQKEVAERIVAQPGGKEYGVLSVDCQLYGHTRITRNVGKAMFNPPPKVDSAVVCIEQTGEGPSEKVRSLVKSAFSMRRKTLVNCLGKDGFDKEKVKSVLKAMGFPEDTRGERLSPKDYIRLGELL